MAEIQPLDIKPEQVSHFNKILTILQNYYFYLDGSETGAGKTYIGAAVAITLGLPVIVFGPKSARNTWRQVFATYGVKPYAITENNGILTYGCLESKNGYQPKHGLLVREDIKGKRTKFYPTELWTRLILNGVFVIFDEGQMMKNASHQHDAAQSLIKHFYTVGNSLSQVTHYNSISPPPEMKSRFAILSASLFDKKENVFNILGILGLTLSGRLNLKTKRVNRLDIQTIINYAQQLNRPEADKFLLNHFPGSTGEDAIEFIYQLFIQTICPVVMSTIPLSGITKDVRNGYYNLTPAELLDYEQAILEQLAISRQRVNSEEYERLKIAVYNSANPQTRTTWGPHFKANMGDLVAAITHSQRAKMRAMVRVAKHILSLSFSLENQVITPKVILMADYYEIIDFLLTELAEYRPVEYTGRINEANRVRNNDAFQQPNNTTRLLIGNPKVGGISINLHDVTGLFPRFMFIMPDNNAISLHQASGRVSRRGTVGVGIVRFFYGKSDFPENKLLNALRNKGEVLETIHKDQHAYGVKFANEYESENEEDLVQNFINSYLQILTDQKISLAEQAALLSTTNQSSLSPTLSPLLGSSLPTLSPLLGSSLPTLSPPLGSSLPTLSPLLGSSLPTLLPLLGSSLPTLSGNVGSSLPTLAGNVGSSLPTLVGNVGSSLPTLAGIGIALPQLRSTNVTLPQVPKTD